MSHWLGRIHDRSQVVCRGIRAVASFCGNAGSVLCFAISFTDGATILGGLSRSRVHLCKGDSQRWSPEELEVAISRHDTRSGQVHRDDPSPAVWGCTLRGRYLRSALLPSWELLASPPLASSRHGPPCR
ncbi:MAG: hypothetical protein QG579_575 [Patescibacteria group bacterium]|nr:hypothetical protein [Patescibacteria group bacterium]